MHRNVRAWCADVTVDSVFHAQTCKCRWAGLNCGGRDGSPLGWCPSFWLARGDIRACQGEALRGSCPKLDWECPRGWPRGCGAPAAQKECQTPWQGVKQLVHRLQDWLTWCTPWQPQTVLPRHCSPTAYSSDCNTVTGKCQVRGGWGWRDGKRNVFLCARACLECPGPYPSMHHRRSLQA